MTIEGRPYLGPDNTYEKQRKDRMGDCIGDYLTDESVSPQQCHEEMLSEVEEWIVYHRANLDKALKLKSLLTGSTRND